jgi:hypothetical protein
MIYPDLGLIPIGLIKSIVSRMELSDDIAW